MSRPPAAGAAPLAVSHPARGLRVMGGSGSAAGTSPARVQAPFGRRLCRVSWARALGAYRELALHDPHGPPDPHPGQFYMLAAQDGWGGGEDDRPYLPRAFSFARTRGGTLSFLLEAVGPGTRRLGALRPGDAAWVTGPLGVGFSLPCEEDPCLLVGGGIGTAPLVAVHDRLGPRSTVLLGFRTRGYAEARRLFASSVELATDDGSAGRRALVTTLLEEALKRRPGTPVLACGPPPMLEAVRALGAELRAPVQLALEARMACGFGACWGCTVPTRAGYVRLCVDGPVLDGDALEPGQLLLAEA